MAEKNAIAEFQRVRNMLTEQVIKKTVVINSGASGFIEIDIPKDKLVFLKGYGYNYFDSTTWRLSTGIAIFPSRTDQEGSVAQPRIFDVPFKCRPNAKARIDITNADTSNNTYEVVFIFMTQSILNETSDGGELIIATGAGTGVISSTAIFNAAGTASAEVVTRGDGTVALAVDTELVIDNATVKIENLFVASTDGTVANSNYLLMDAAGHLQTDVLTLPVGTAVMVASTPVTLATDDTLTAAANALLVTIDSDTNIIQGDTTSIDTKTPSLGNSNMVGSVPVTLASDDTLTAAANALLATIDSDTNQIQTDTTALVANEAALTPVHTAPVIGSGNTVALAANASRKSAMFQNISDEVIWLNIAAGTAVASTGIKLLPEASFNMSAKEGNLAILLVNAICASGSKTLLVTESV